MHVYEFMANLSMWKHKREYKNIQSNSQRVKPALSRVHNNISFCEKVLNYLKNEQSVRKYKLQIYHNHGQRGILTLR